MPQDQSRQAEKCSKEIGFDASCSEMLPNPSTQPGFYGNFLNMFMNRYIFHLLGRSVILICSIGRLCSQRGQRPMVQLTIITPIFKTLLFSNLSKNLIVFIILRIFRCKICAQQLDKKTYVTIDTVIIVSATGSYIIVVKKLGLNRVHRKPPFSEISWSVSALLSGSCKSWPGHLGQNRFRGR